MGRRSRSMAQQLLLLLSLAAFLLVTVVHSETVEAEAKEAIAGGTEDGDNQVGQVRTFQLPRICCQRTA
uniref:Putative cysteine-type endopeptidase inhibitor n=1 Tax=Anopheles darlingi TaxID=43151 RepID=A0A2M4D6I7_ANODA